MITVCVPTDDERDGIATFPDDVRVVVWDGGGEIPDGAAETRFLLAEYMSDTSAKALLAAMPQLEVIQLLSAGVERWLPFVPDGVTLCNARGVHTGSTAELCVAGILAVLRGLPQFGEQQRTGTWDRHMTRDLDDARLLVLGAGDIGRRVAAGLEVFGARTTYVGHTARDGVLGIGEVSGLLGVADIVAITLPLTDETRGLVDADFLGLLPDGAIVANISRGSIVDTDALLAELVSGRLSAFLDVTDPEPLPPDHPLWHAPNVVITPHVGGGTLGWQKRGYRMVREQIARFVSHEPLENVVGSEY
jgi:phosphoglycerate dehydrogenase-like enzyme